MCVRHRSFDFVDEVAGCDDIDASFFVVLHGHYAAPLAWTARRPHVMPGMYSDKDYDLAGFCVGVVEKNAIIDGSQ